MDVLLFIALKSAPFSDAVCKCTPYCHILPIHMRMTCKLSFTDVIHIM